MRNKFKKLFDFFLCLTATLCLMSCLNSVTSSSNSEKENQPDENTTVLFKGSINIESSLAKSLLSSNNTSRSASPEAIDMTSHEFYVIAESKAGASLTADVGEDPDTHAITFEMPLEFGEWTIETGICKSADGQKILVDTFEIKLFANTPTFSHAFYLKPVNEGMGSINLEMVVPDNVSKMRIQVHSQPDGANFDTAECTASGAAPDRKIILNRENVTGGIYNLVFTYYDVNNNPLFSTIQTINVIPGLETTKWVSGGSSILISNIGKFEVTEALITAWRTQRSTYYVDCNKGYDTYSGGPLDPFESLVHAVKIINDLYSTEEKTATIIVLEGTIEMISESLEFNPNKNITIKSSGSGTIKLIRDPEEAFSGPFIKIPSTTTFTMENLILDGRDVEAEDNIGVMNNGTFIMNSGKICGNKNSTAGGGAGVYSPGVMELNGGEISGNVSNGNGAGILLDSQNITISGGIVKNNLSGSIPSNLFLPSGSKIKVERAIANGSEINVSFGWTPKKVTSTTDPAIFTTGYGATNSETPSTYFKSDKRYIVMTLPTSTTPATLEAGVALSGKDYVNLLSNAFSMTFATNFDKFKHGDTQVENRTIKITPTIKLNGSDITDNVLNSTDNPLKWTLKLYYRGMEVGSSESSELLIDSGYAGRYDLHVYAEYLGLVKDAEFVITGFTNIIPITTKEALRNQFSNISNGTAEITRDTCIDLRTNLDFSTEEYLPISAKVVDGRITNTGTDFEGVFDGNGHTITLGKVVSEDFIGICWKNKGTIQNVILELKDGDNYKIEVEEGTSNHNDATDSSKYKFHAFGGICYHNEGIIRNCWNKINITKASYYGRVGGICCVNSGLIENCINTGDLKNCSWSSGKGSWAGLYGVAGGITGVNWNDGFIRNCVNYGEIWLNKYYDSSGSGINGLPGAICGAQDTNRNTAKIEYCYWRENCVRCDNTTNRDASNSTQRNWLVCEPSSYSRNTVQGGTFAYNGYFPSNTSGTLSYGPTINGQPQSLAYGTDLVDALNAYANTVDPNNTYLKRWRAGSGYAAVFDE